MRNQPQRSNSQPSTAAILTSRSLVKGYAFLAVITVGLMVLGALVRAHGAGLACPDWPLCFGEFVPGFDLKIAFEWSHRVVAGAVALIFTFLAIRSLANQKLRQEIGWLVGGAAVILIVQIILGALTVWQLLASWTVTSHLLTANAFVVCLAFLTVRLSEFASPRTRSQTLSSKTIGLVSATLMLLIVQVALGGLMSSTYAGLVCPDWPTCIDGIWFPGWEGARGLHLLHRITAYVLLAALVGCVLVTSSSTPAGRLLRFVLGLGILQVVVGIANVILRLPVEITALHSLLAALLMITLALATREAWLSRVPASSASQAPGTNPIA